MRSIALLLVIAFASASAFALDFSGLAPIGAVTTVARTERGIALGCADGGAVEISILAPDLVRVRSRFGGQPVAPDHSWAIERSNWPAIPWQLAEADEAVTVTTSALDVVVRRSPLLVEFRDATTHKLINADARPMGRDPHTGRIGAAKRLGVEEHFYGLGEKAARLDRRRGKFEMWNSDTPGYVDGTDPIYQSVPFYLGWQDGAAYGLFYDNSFRSHFDFGQLSQESVDYTADGGELNYYFFGGPSMKAIVSRYTELTGRMPLPPLWALGNQQSRYSYYPEAVVDEIARTYRGHDLPLDVLYLDIHYMNGYRDFTWNPTRFPDPKAMLGRLRAQGIKVVTIVDPGVKYQPPAAHAPAPASSPDRANTDASYYVYDQGLAQNYFLRRRDGSLYVGEVWPGKAVFVDYTLEAARRWWGDLHRPFLDEGVAGLWDDMNEPSDFLDKSGATQMDVVFDDHGAHTSYAQHRNLFALNMVRATYEGLARLRPDQRPFIVTRAGYAGVQRYATMWTGDNNATWDSLALNLPMFASLGLSGEAFVGSDVPGFIGRADGELLSRAYEVAFLVPLCRNHGAIDGYDHEPWRFGPRYETVVRKYLKLRYELLPFLYTTLEEAHRTGVPLFRPLLLNFQEDLNTLTLDDEFMVGDSLLAAPILHPDQRARDVYLPTGAWYDFWTGARIAGGTTITVAAPLDRIPLYVRGGSILPMTTTMNFVGEKPWDPLRLQVYPDEAGNATGSVYEDDGVSPAYQTGEFRRTAVRFTTGPAGSRLTIDGGEGTYRPPSRHLEFVVHGRAGPRQVRADGAPLGGAEAGGSEAGWWRDETGAAHVRLADDLRPHTIELE